MQRTEVISVVILMSLVWLFYVPTDCKTNGPLGIIKMPELENKLMQRFTRQKIVAQDSNFSRMHTELIKAVFAT